MRMLPAEDVLGLGDDTRRDGGKTVIAVPALRRIANFDDLDPLRLEPDVSVVVVKPGEAIPAEADLVLIPGSKSTIADLAFIREQGWDIDILAHHRRGGRVLGLCGGYQMLGRRISDPEGIEGRAGSVAGLGLLDVETVIGGDKTTDIVEGRHVATNELIAGYEIHLGRTDGPDCVRPFLDLDGRPDGACSADGLVAGTYVHGIFSGDEFRRAFILGIGGRTAELSYEAQVEAALDGLADHLERSVDVDRMLAIAGVQATSAAPTTTARKRTAHAPR
jgi:adenosylcobyric acid synthase